MTSVSIQDAFLQLLLEKDFESISMRDIANVAGVSIGGLYHYFPSKDAIAAMTVRSWVRKLSLELSAVASTGNRSMAATVHLLVQTMVSTMLEGESIDKWRALTVLERRISPLPVYRRLYMHHVDLYQEALANATDWPAGRPGDHEAFNAYTLVDSLVKQTLLVRVPCPSADGMIADIVCAVTGYLRTALAMAPHGG